MVANLRNLVLFSALTALALVTWFLARPATESVSPTRSSAEMPQGYYLIDAVLFGTNDSGRIHYRVEADRVNQKAQGSDFELDGVHVEWTPEADVRWDLSAAQGVLAEDRSYLRFPSVVRMVSTADDTPTVIETSMLSVAMDDYVATTEADVLMMRGQATITATGLRADLDDDHLLLKTNATIRYYR